MAMVETPDRIMTTGGWGDNGGGSMIWIILFAFLFMFRGGGFGGCGDGHRDGGYRGDDGYGGGNYKRYDADFDYLKRDNMQIEKEQIRASYEAKIAELECCCKTNANIDSVRCEVKEQGCLTRQQNLDLENREIIRSLTAENNALRQEASEARIIAGVDRKFDERFDRLARSNHGHYGYGHGGGHCGFPVMAAVEPIRYVPEVRDDGCRHREC